MSIRSNRVQRDDGSETITVYGLGGIAIAHSDHPNFAAIVAAVESPDEPDADTLRDLFDDVAQAIERKFKRLTDRISVRGETIYLDLEPVHTSLSEAILSTLQAGEDFAPLVKFMERLEANPNPQSREALYRWLDRRNFTITEDGLVVGYKGVTYNGAYETGEHAGEPVAGSGKGHAFVNGIEYGATTEDGRVTEAAKIPYPIGAVVEMPRSEVDRNTSYECGQGLHVGTYAFAQSYAAGGVMLEVHVDPRDVVSVPNSESSSKFRTCRLTVVKELDKVNGGYTTPVRHPDPEPVQFDPEDFEDLDEDYEDEDSYYEPSSEPEIVPEEESEDFDSEEEQAEEAKQFENEERDVISPAAAAFDNMLKRALRRKQAIVSYIEHMTAKEGRTWVYTGSGDPKDPNNWKVNK